MAPSKWKVKRTLLVTAIARNVGDYGINWDAVAAEMEESPKSCESAFWRLDQTEKGQLGDDIRILKGRIKGTAYTKMLPDFPGYTLEDLKERATVLAGGTNNSWVEEERVAMFDLEFYNFDADFGFLLSWSIKHLDGHIVHDVLTRPEAINYNKLDKRLCETFLEEIKNVDLLVGFYSTKMDVPYIRSRCIWWELDFPKFREKFHHDMYYTSKRVLKLSRGGQAAVGRFLLKGDSTKNSVDMQLWLRARLGDEKALAEVLDHNDRDVRDLELIYKELIPYVRMVRKSI